MTDNVSQYSTMSQQSVSYFGEEVELEQAIDSCFRDLQTFLNGLQCSLRSLATLSDMGVGFEEALKHGDDIEDSIDDMAPLFKELKSLMSQIMLKPEDNEEKEILKKHKLERKQKKDQEKQLKKEQKMAEKGIPEGEES